MFILLLIYYVYLLRHFPPKLDFCLEENLNEKCHKSGKCRPD